MSDNEDVIDRLENENKTQQDEEESSDEEYTLDVKKEQKSDDEDEDEENSGKEKKNWRKATPEEVFARFDEDNSGFIDFEEFRNMLPHLNVNLSEAKALKYLDLTIGLCLRNKYENKTKRCMTVHNNIFNL